MKKPAPLSWLPEHQYHVFYTLAHADSIIERIADLNETYIDSGPFGLETARRNGREHLSISSVAPLPEAITRLTADALNQLRGAIEHVLYAEIEHELGRSFEDDESKLVEMPARLTQESIDEWFNHGKRKKFHPLSRGSRLGKRIADLQPHHRRKNPEQHPLFILADHTNLAKHRTPAVTATKLAEILPAHEHPELVVHQHDSTAPLPGTPLVGIPEGTVAGIDVWPTIKIQRPTDRTWQVLLKELSSLESWVRTIAIPHLILGHHNVVPLPPQLDTGHGYESFSAALKSAGTSAAGERSQNHWRAKAARQGLQEVISCFDISDQPRLLRLLDTVSDEVAIEAIHQIASGKYTASYQLSTDHVAGLLANA